MAEIRAARSGDLDSFPGCAHVVDGTPPEAQCQEAQIASVAGSIVDGSPNYTEVAAFAGIDLTGKKITVTLPAPEGGTFNVLSNTDDVVVTDNTFGATDAGGAAATFHDTGQVYLTRSEDSFIRYIESQAAAFTKVNGQLYTDIADPPLDGACSDTWAPE